MLRRSPPVPPPQSRSPRRAARTPHPWTRRRCGRASSCRSREAVEDQRAHAVVGDRPAQRRPFAEDLLLADEARRASWAARVPRAGHARTSALTRPPRTGRPCRKSMLDACPPPRRGRPAAPRLIRVNTVNPPGNETAAAELLRAYLEENGVACELYARDPARANPRCPHSGLRRGPEAVAPLAHGHGARRPVRVDGRSLVRGAAGRLRLGAAAPWT